MAKAYAITLLLLISDSWVLCMRYVHAFVYIYKLAALFQLASYNEIHVRKFLRHETFHAHNSITERVWLRQTTPHAYLN